MFHKSDLQDVDFFFRLGFISLLLDKLLCRSSSRSSCTERIAESVKVDAFVFFLFAIIAVAVVCNVVGSYRPAGIHFYLNSLPNDKILDVTKLKAFEDDKINDAQMRISVFDRVENIVGKGKNAGYQHFLLFPQCFQQWSLSWEGP